MALLLDVPAGQSRRPRSRALLMVMVVLVLVVSIVWQSQGKAKAFAPLIAIGIGELISVGGAAVVGGALTDKLVNGGGALSFMGGLLKKGWNKLTGDDDEPKEVLAPRNMGDLIAASPEGLPSTGVKGYVCTDYVSKVDFIDVAGKPDLMVTIQAIVGNIPNGKIEDCLPPKRTSLSSANVSARCRLNGQIFENLVTLSGNLDMGWTKNRINGIQNGMCYTGTAGTAQAQLLAVRFMEKPNPTSWRFPVTSEWVNPLYQDEVLGGGTVTGIKKCISDTNPADVQTTTSTSTGVKTLPVVTCPPGYHPDRVEYTYKNGWADSPVRQLGGAEINKTAYPQCQDQPCTLKVSVNGIPCSIGLPECWDWMHTYPPEQLKCEYGPYAVGLAECGALEYAYRSGAGVTVDPNDAQNPYRLVPAQPGGQPDPNLAPSRPYEPNPWPTTNPQPSTNPSTTPVPAPTFPTQGNNPDPRPPGGAPVLDPESGQNCLAGMWSWNPVNWVYTPVKCAMTWAFVPKPEALTRVRTDLQTAVGGSGVGAWFDAVPALFNIPGGGGCEGPTITFPLTGTKFKLADACSDPMATVAAICKALLTVLIVTVAVLHGVRAISGAFGYQFSMGGKGTGE